MAGDWIKMRVDLPNDPAVIAISVATGLDEYAVVGRLHKLWSWADSQSRDGHARGVTEKWLDKFIHSDGFAAAMVTAGWLKVTAHGISFPNFDRHNGKPAKNRALTTRRQQSRRSRIGNDAVTPVSRTHPLPEKRREVSITSTTVAKSSEASQTVAEPPEGKSRSTPPPRTRSEAKTRQLLEEQRTREVSDPPPHVADLASKLKATAPPKPQRIPRGNGEPHEALAEPEWWESPAGIQREATNRGVEVIPDQPFEDFKARVFAAAGEGPWMHHLAPPFRERVDHWRVVGVNP